MIEGNGGTIARDQAAPPFRRFFVGADPTRPGTEDYVSPGAGALTLRDVTLTGGFARGGDALRGGGGAGMGDAIFNQGTVVIERSRLVANTAAGGSPTNPGAGASGGGIGGSGGGGTGGGGFGGGGGAGSGPGSAAGAGGFGGGGGGGAAGAAGGAAGFGGGTPSGSQGDGGAGMGGAIFNMQGRVTIRASTFTRNVAVGGVDNVPDHGKGIGGAVFDLSGS